MAHSDLFSSFLLGKPRPILEADAGGLELNGRFGSWLGVSWQQLAAVEDVKNTQVVLIRFD